MFGLILLLQILPTMPFLQFSWEACEQVMRQKNGTSSRRKGRKESLLRCRGQLWNREKGGLRKKNKSWILCSHWSIKQNLQSGKESFSSINLHLSPSQSLSCEDARLQPLIRTNLPSREQTPSHKEGQESKEDLRVLQQRRFWKAVSVGWECS